MVAFDGQRRAAAHTRDAGAKYLGATVIVRGAREDLACENDELELKCDYLYCTSAQALTLSNPNPNPSYSLSTYL